MDCPLKIKLFLWLALAKRIHVWDFLAKKFYAGPGRCPLCRSEEETVSHLFVHCSYFQNMWPTVSRAKGFSFDWNGEELQESLKNWLTDPSV